MLLNFNSINTVASRKPGSSKKLGFLGSIVGSSGEYFMFAEL